MTLDELRSEAAKLTPPPGPSLLFQETDDGLCYLQCRLININYLSLYLALCVGAHGWLNYLNSITLDHTLETFEKMENARKHRKEWQRHADAAYELLQKENGQ